MVSKVKSSVYSREEAVARIAFLCSDVVYSIQPNLTDAGSFSPTLDHLFSTKTPSLVRGESPQVIPLLSNTDPFQHPLRPAREGRVVSVLAAAESLLLAIPHLRRLSSYPVIIHVFLPAAPFSDHSTIAALRQTGFAIIKSSSLQEAQDIAILSHSIAITSGKGVIHFSEKSQDDLPVLQEALEVIESVIPRHSPTENDSVSPDAIYRQDLEEHPVAADVSELFTTGNADIANGQSTGVHANGHVENGEPIQGLYAAKVIQDKDLCSVLEQIFLRFSHESGRHYSCFEYSGPADASNVITLFGSHERDFEVALKDSKPADAYYGFGLILIRVYRPWSIEAFLGAIPKEAKSIAVLEQLQHRSTKWTPVYIDVLKSCRQQPESQLSVVAYQTGVLSSDQIPTALQLIATNLQSEVPQQNLAIGLPFPALETSPVDQPRVENPYLKILQQLFGTKLHLLNKTIESEQYLPRELVSAPEFLLGAFISRNENRKQLLLEVSSTARHESTWGLQAKDAISKWAANTLSGSLWEEDLANNVLEFLKQQKDSLCQRLLLDIWMFKDEVPWIIGSESWAYDIGSSGIHHLLKSGANVNMLIIDSEPYSHKSAGNIENRKKDIGLYAMNFGNAYVASVAVYSSYTQVMHAMIEAQQFDGPSIVLAYLPFSSELDSPLKIFQDTKVAVDSGYWPLYRWSPPSATSRDPVFHLDSERVKQELKAFVDRENHLTKLARETSVISTSISHSHGSELRQLRKIKAKEAMDKLMDGLSGPPVTILFASDGGNAESVAKRLGRRGKARGLKAKIMAMDDFPFEDLSTEKNVIFCTSTAGQGEFPQNGRDLWEALKGSTDTDLSKTNFSVFALGDSHYWPRKEDKHYYNKPGKDLDARLEALGGMRLTEIGLGDDQDPDGYETGYGVWEPQIWKALGADDVDADFEEPKTLTNEDIKIASNFLRGTIAEGLGDTTTGAIAESDAQLTKFHGTYMQDDRDLRDQRKSQGLEPAYSFMVRVRMSGGVCQPAQWIAMDKISDTWGNHTFKLTTRQTFQFHGILKANLRTAIREINYALLTTIGACGDVNRNVMCSAIPSQSRLHAEVYDASKAISNRLLPSTSAYHEIWLQDGDGKKTQVAGEAVQDFEPLYGPTYLPRKFKITIAVPPVNDTDVYAHDIGLIAIANDFTSGLLGFNVLIGGGMGMTHGSKKTYARLGQDLGFCLPNEVSEVAEAIMLVQRDNGDRTNRKHARLKYTIDDMGLDEFKRQVEERLGRALPASRKHQPFQKNIDDFSGWVKGDDGLYSHTIFIENGRVEDRSELRAKTGLLEIAQYMLECQAGHYRLTGNQHVIVCGIRAEQLPRVKELLAKFKLDNLNFSGLRLSSSACVAFPTCGLAMAESERYLPTLITKLEDTLIEAGLRESSIVMRMTGCPNGCARPWVAELACVGKAPGTYNLMLGGGYHGERLNKLYRPSVNEDEILEILKPMFKRYALERHDGEHFGDWVIRAGYITAVERGGQHGAMHEGVPDDDEE